MIINFKEITKKLYIQELKNFKNIAVKFLEQVEKYYLKMRKKLIKRKNHVLKKFLNNEYETEIRKSDYQFKLSHNQLNYYRILSSLYQTLFSIWETEIQEYGNSINYKNCNNDIAELYCVVNVLKHGKGASLENLKANYKYYLQHHYFDIISATQSGIIINISKTNFIEFCDKIIDIWYHLE